jgi:hypothetical protein
MRPGAFLPGVDAQRDFVLFIHCFLDDSGKDSNPQNPYVIMAGYFAEMGVWIELWDEGEFNKYLPQIIEDFRRGVGPTAPKKLGG